MYIASRDGKLFHSSECIYVRRIRKENRIVSYDADELRKLGYIHCSCCGRVNHKYREEKERIDRFCAKRGYKTRLYDGALYVVSDGDTAWKIVSSREDGKVKLLHQNLHPNFRDTRHAALPDRVYHDQHFSGRTILYLIKDIADHDFYTRDRLRDKDGDYEYAQSPKYGTGGKAGLKGKKRRR